MIVNVVNEYTLYNLKKKEDSINEYKEFFLTNNLSLNDIDETKFLAGLM